MDNDNFNSGTPNPVPEKLYALLLHCSHLLSRGHHYGMGIRPSQLRILSLLASCESILQHDMLAILQIRAASLSELLAKLESKGLVTRSKDGAGRGIEVQITALGKTVAEAAKRNGDEINILFQALSEDEQRQLVGLLTKLLEDWHNRYHGRDEDEKHTEFGRRERRRVAGHHEEIFGGREYRRRGHHGEWEHE